MTKCWAKEHKKRPTMQDILKDMESFIQGEFLNPTLARPHRGKKELSVLSTPVVNGDGSQKSSKFVKHSVQMENRAFEPEGVVNEAFLQDDYIRGDDSEGAQEDYAAEYQYLDPQLLRLRQPMDLNVDGIDPEIVLDNKTYDVVVVGNQDAVNSQDVSIAMAEEHTDTESANQESAYDIPKSKTTIDQREIEEGDNADPEALLNGIKATTLEKDGYKMESGLADASVLY